MEDQEKSINGEVKTYKTGEVAEILGESAQMIRFYCEEFSEFLNINTTPGKHRLFTLEDIEKLKYIIYLCKDQNFSIRKAKEFLSTPEGKVMAPIQNIEDKVNYLVEAVFKKMHEIYYNDFNSHITELKNQIIQLQEENKQLKLNYEFYMNKFIETTNEIPKLIQGATEQYNTKLDKFIEEYRSQQNKKNKSLFSRLFGR